MVNNLNYENLFIKYNGVRLKEELEKNKMQPFIGGRREKKIIGIINYKILNQSINLKNMLKIISNITDKFFFIIEESGNNGEIYDLDLTKLYIYFDNTKFDLSKLYELIISINKEYKNTLECVGVFHYSDVIIGNIGCSKRIKKMLFSEGISFLNLLNNYFNNKKFNIIVTQEIKDIYPNINFIKIQELHKINFGNINIYSIK